MAEENFTVADFFRLGNEAAGHETELRIKEAEALAAVRVKLAEAGLSEGHGTATGKDEHR